MQDKRLIHKFFSDSHYLFICSFFLLYVFSFYLRSLSQLFLIVILGVSGALFILYSNVRYAHYERIYEKKIFLFRYVIEILLLTVGSVYSFLFHYFYVKSYHQVYFLHEISLLFFVIPTLIGTMRLREREKNKKI